MKRFLHCLVIFLVATHFSLKLVSAEDAMVKKMVDDNTAFTLDLYTKLKSREGNLFFSPFSISTALAMTYAGARENTAKQMAGVLHFPEEQDQLHHAMGDLISDLNDIRKQGDIELRVANALWAQKDYKFLKEFSRVILNSYKAELKHVDFAIAHETARQAINAWVEQQTNQKIKDMIQPGILDA